MSHSATKSVQCSLAMLFRTSAVDAAANTRAIRVRQIFLAVVVVHGNVSISHHHQPLVTAATTIDRIHVLGMRASGYAFWAP